MPPFFTFDRRVRDDFKSFFGTSIQVFALARAFLLRLQSCFKGLHFDFFGQMWTACHKISSSSMTFNFDMERANIAKVDSDNL